MRGFYFILFTVITIIIIIIIQYLFSTYIPFGGLFFFVNFLHLCTWLIFILVEKNCNKNMFVATKKHQEVGARGQIYNPLYPQR